MVIGTITYTDETWKLMEQLIKDSGSRDETEIWQKALSLYKYAVDAKPQGGILKICYPDGQETTIVL